MQRIVKRGVCIPNSVQEKTVMPNAGDLDNGFTRIGRMNNWMVILSPQSIIAHDAERHKAMLKRLFQAVIIYIVVRTAWFIWKHVVPFALFVLLFWFLSH